MSQLNTVNNTDTVIDLNLNTNHLIDQPFSMDQQGIVSAAGTFYYGIMEGEISTPLELFWPIHFTRISIPQAQVWPVVWPQVRIVFVNQASWLGLLLAQAFIHSDPTCEESLIIIYLNKLNVCILTIIVCDIIPYIHSLPPKSKNFKNVFSRCIYEWKTSSVFTWVTSLTLL